MAGPKEAVLLQDVDPPIDESLPFGEVREARLMGGNASSIC